MIEVLSMFDLIIRSIRNMFNKPDGIPLLERVIVNFDLARSNTFTSNFISILYG